LLGIFSLKALATQCTGENDTKKQIGVLVFVCFTARLHGAFTVTAADSNTPTSQN